MLRNWLLVSFAIIASTAGVAQSARLIKVNLDRDFNGVTPHCADVTVANLDDRTFGPGVGAVRITYTVKDNGVPFDVQALFEVALVDKEGFLSRTLPQYVQDCPTPAPYFCGGDTGADFCISNCDCPAGVACVGSGPLQFPYSISGAEAFADDFADASEPWELAGGTTIDGTNMSFPPGGSASIEVRGLSLLDRYVISSSGVIFEVSEIELLVESLLDLQAVPCPGGASEVCFDVTGADAGDLLVLVGGTSPGSHGVPNCTTTVGLAAPRRLADAEAGSDGGASLCVPAPVEQTLWQVVNMATCEVSNLVEIAGPCVAD